MVGSFQFSRLPDSATLAPLRLVELALLQGGAGAHISSLRLAEGAYLGACDFSIGFLSFPPFEPILMGLSVE
jgi:hypothetical protein